MGGGRASTRASDRCCDESSARTSASTSSPRRSWTSPPSSPSSRTCRRRGFAFPYRKLSKLHPAQIADLVEQASHEEGEEIIEAVGADRELEADVFEELDTTHQLEFLESRSDADAARLLARMEPDNAADLISEIDQDRRLPILERLPDIQKTKVRQLLSYSADTAGGLMNPDFVSVPATATVADALEAIRTSRVPAEALHAVFVLDESGQPDRRGVDRAARARPGTRTRAQRLAHAPGPRAPALGPAPGVAHDE